MSIEIRIVTLLLLATTLYFLINLFIHFRQRRKIIDEIHEAERTVHTSFDALKDSLKVYEKSSGLNQDQIASELKKDFKDTELLIEKEIKDIESI